MRPIDAFAAGSRLAAHDRARMKARRSFCEALW
jgi:hypothetical protein